MLSTLTEDEERRLLDAAIAARRNARAPYSNYHVGAAILDGNGTLWGGCNVESASYGLTICAERTAIFKAVSEGAGGFRGAAVVIDENVVASPCGACRQVMWDQCGNIVVLLATVSGLVERTTLAELLPRAFELGGPR